MSNTIKTVIFWLVIVVAGMLLWQTVKTDHGQRESPEISYSEFLTRVDGGDVSKVVFNGSQITGTGPEGQQFRVQGPSFQAELLDTLRRKNVEIWFRDTNAGSWPLQLLGSWAPLILLAALWYFMIHQMGRTQKSLKAAASGQNASAQNIDKIG